MEDDFLDFLSFATIYGMVTHQEEIESNPHYSYLHNPFVAWPFYCDPIPPDEPVEEDEDPWGF